MDDINCDMHNVMIVNEQPICLDSRKDFCKYLIELKDGDKMIYICGKYEEKS